MRNRRIIMMWLAATIAVMFALPFCMTRFVPADAGMALCMMLFFIVNPIYSAILGFRCGRDVRQMWSLPLISSITFLAGTLLFFDIREVWFIIYAATYLAIGWVAMGINKYLNSKR